MKLWIRVDACTGRDPKVAEFALAIGDDLATAVGRLVLIWSVMAEHAPDGWLGKGEGNAHETPRKCVPNAVLEAWGMYTPKRGKPRGTMADAFRSLFVASDGYVDGWTARQGALIERAEKDRARKSGSNSTEFPWNFRGISVATERNGTVRRSPPSSPSGEEPPGGGREEPDETPPDQATSGAPAPDITPKVARAGRKRREQTAVERAAVDEIVAYDRELHPRRRAVPDAVRSRVVARLREGYTTEDIRGAMRAAAEDEWCRQTGNHDLTHVCRNSHAVERYLAKATAAAEEPAWVDEFGVLTAHGARQIALSTGMGRMVS